MTPTPEQIRDARHRAGLSQSQAARLIHSTLRSWQAWEAGERKMHAGLWELFCKKISDLSKNELTAQKGLRI